MSIKLDCPRCKTPLQVPGKLAGGYVNCPHCKGRLWVSKDAAAEKTPSAPLAEPPLKREPAPIEPSPPSPAIPDPPPPPAPRKKVARFISAETADSTLRPAADGKLPELQLDEGAIRQKPQEKSSSMNPLVLLGVLSVSVVLSIVLAMIDLNPPADPRSKTKEQQRYLIERDFFGTGNIDNRTLKPYQILLREAQRAYTRGDYKTERENYRRVLEMLRAERGADRKGLTGSRRRDMQLEEAISVLLSGE
ncbi:MAG: hypothetical protein KKE86_06155 [Planctomycetes bacterium]|nr:hypothetical protein [Planctomycetota bacterium]MBU4398904.1 hypothetical protein [Planctomycetota bacterium]MCG2682196.1 hypothetical protein [Planctomycetales bacterium]